MRAIFFMFVDHDESRFLAIRETFGQKQEIYSCSDLFRDMLQQLLEYPQHYGSFP